MKGITLLGLCSILLACTGKDAICDCIDAGKELDKQTSHALQQDEVKDVNAIREAKAKKERACKDFQFMDGAELKRRMETCD